MYRNCNNYDEDDVVASEYDNYYENHCSNVGNNNFNMYDDCACGFESGYNPFPENPVLAQSYVPIQRMNKTFKPSVGLKMGTIFPELVSPYMPGQSMAEIEYLKRRNTVGEGCNR